jgi:hypothetical protein
VLGALRERNFAKVESLVALYPDIVQLYAHRRAIQVVGCDGALVAHIQLSSEQFIALAVDD